VKVRAALAALSLSACAPTHPGRVTLRPGPLLAARSVAVLPFAHRFSARPHEALLRALPLCEAVLERGGLLVLGPDEMEIGAGALSSPNPFALPGILRAALAANLSPDAMLLLRASVEERVARTARALFDPSGRPRGSGRDVQVVVRVVVELLEPGTAEVVVRGMREAAEDPFAESPEHDGRPVVSRLARDLAREVLATAAPRLARAERAPEPLALPVVAGPRALERFALGGERPASADPLLAHALRDAYLRGVVGSLDPRTLAVLLSAPPGVIVRERRDPLKAGDVVMAVDDQEVATPWALHRALHRAGAGAMLTVWRSGETLRLTLAGVVGGPGPTAKLAGDRWLGEVDGNEAVAVRAATVGKDVAHLGVEIGPQAIDLRPSGCGRRRLEHLGRPRLREDHFAVLGKGRRLLRPGRGEDHDLAGIRRRHLAHPHIGGISVYTRPPRMTRGLTQRPALYSSTSTARRSCSNS
jgi:hypothetical protein